jgi:23S rRNA pseudouridine2605 synthase
MAICLTASPKEENIMEERLQKLISQAGITSRRAAEELILDGRVTVNGRVVSELGAKADLAKDKVTVDGKPIQAAEKLYYVLLHKPAGYVTSLKDPQGRQLVTELIKDVGERLFPVGRLDYNSEGLLLMTNDGEWANRLMHPRHQVDKEYHVRVRGKVDPQQVKRLAGGIDLEDGPAAGATVRVLKADQNNDWLSITIREGRNRQIRRMCAAVGLFVVRLRRIRYGNLTLGGLKPGEYRLLSAEEAQNLDAPPAPPERKTAERPAAPKPEQSDKPRPPRSAAPSASRPAKPGFKTGEKPGHKSERNPTKRTPRPAPRGK